MKLAKLDVWIAGQPPSKSNSYKTGRTKTGRTTFYKSKECKDYERDFALQYAPQAIDTIRGDFAFLLTYYTRNKASDLDGSYKIILDCLQDNGAVKNDNNLAFNLGSKYIERKNPGVRIEVWELPPGMDRQEPMRMMREYLNATVDEFERLQGAHRTDGGISPEGR